MPECGEGDADRGEIMGVVRRFFEVGATKELSSLRDVQLDDPGFSSFGDVPPYGLKDFRTTIALEELRFAGISDYSYEIRSPKVGVFGGAAVAAFGIVQKGMLVDNKSFTGECIEVEGRATFVLVRRGDGAWKIVHIHMSRAP